jgi:hypothetical protein
MPCRRPVASDPPSRSSRTAKALTWASEIALSLALLALASVTSTSTPDTV